ncbi:tRNA (uridine(34)/cytosine(34)/5-carboxymethylaminomethyluridine(34)-2'-O)-methyltransferase TrmL [Enemella dayhoffiae]|uniref:Putative tRNA (cytidine(34)-2'-O)-methyltransferase n=1 Tax=Enemella dayhoffiae TaxID=2016507 RepID=A0A255GXU8_9ACTN|nr:tRNA (cytidine(34)-2'-O)-methyltransferase [Enemella dayhoffiae]OYO18434.1 tRNA (uridine(34)/cytosine(34)/5-carboxymethylaminomethyluridine(34)-2'-O)-methyltransferase TrmL [Enemella dayhoffiae]
MNQLPDFPGCPIRLLFHEPRIPGNTGATIRLAAAIGCELHLVGPLGFELSDTKLKRAGLDYHDLASLTVHEDLDQAYAALLPARVFAFSTSGARTHTEIGYAPGDVLLFGPEPTGLAAEVLADPRITDRVRIPMLAGRRSLNLATSAGIAGYEAWRQLGFIGAAAPVTPPAAPR